MATGFKENGVDLDVRYLRKDELNLGSIGTFTWGDNNVGQLGLSLPTTVNLSSPTQVSTANTWMSIHAGCATFFAIDFARRLWSWGNNEYGQLGHGDLINRSSPTLVDVYQQWADVSANYRSVVAVTEAGRLATWGENESGQLGTGNTTPRSAPGLVGSLTNWKQVSTSSDFYGDTFVGAVKTDGTLWTWGKNGAGALGSGANSARSSPVQVGALKNWKKVVCGANFMVAIKTDGTLWSWGDNVFGMLGSGTTTPRSSPVQVGALTDWADVSVRSHSVLAIKTNGTLWGWGADNSNLGFGNSSLTAIVSPTQVGALTDWKYVVAGEYCSFAIKLNGSLWACGRNNFGQLGDGTTTMRSTFTQIGTLNNWAMVETARSNYVGSSEDHTTMGIMV